MKNVDNSEEKGITPYQEVKTKIVTLRNVPVIADADVAALYGVETKRVNEAVRNNSVRFPKDYMFELTKSELRELRSKNSSTNVSPMNRNSTKVRSLKRELVELHKETDKEKQVSKMKHFGDVLTDIVMPDLDVAETESSLELNFIIGKIKHTVKRVKKETQNK